MKLRSLLIVALAVIALPSLGGCSAADSSADEAAPSATEIAGSSISGTANSTESTGSMAVLEKTSPSRMFLDRVIPSALAATTCPTLAQATCAGQVLTLTYDSCSFGNSAATWSGSQILTFNSGCTATPEGSSVTLTRTFGADTSRTSAGDTKVTLDSATASGYASSVSGGATVVWSGGNRTITINGIHYVATARSGKELFDHTVSSSSVSVTGHGPSRVISSGTITVQHNLAKYSAAASITTPLTFQAACCHPVGGVLTSTLTGAKTGTETLTYGPTCGSATFVDSTNTTSTVTLNECL